MTAREVIEALARHDPDADVNFGYEGVFELVTRVEVLGPDTGVFAGGILLLGAASDV